MEKRLNKFLMGWSIPGQPSSGCPLTNTPPLSSCPSSKKSSGTTETHRPSSCSPRSKVEPACPPVVEVAIKSVCGGGRLLFSLFVLFLMMTAIYWLSVTSPPHPTIDQSHSVPSSSNQQETSESNESST